jgi:hypothetical protein
VQTSDHHEILNDATSHESAAQSAFVYRAEGKIVITLVPKTHKNVRQDTKKGQ